MAPPPPKATPSKPAQIAKQRAYFAAESGCQKGDKCMYLQEMENGRPKPALPEDVARLEARAKTNPALRPPSKAPDKAPTIPQANAVAKALRHEGPKFDFDLFYDCTQPMDVFMSVDKFIDMKFETGDICPEVKNNTVSSHAAKDIPFTQSDDLSRKSVRYMG